MIKFALNRLFCICKSDHGWFITTPLFIYASSATSVVGMMSSTATALNYGNGLLSLKIRGKIKFMWAPREIKQTIYRWIIGPITDDFKLTGAWTYVYMPDGSSKIIREGYLTRVNKRWGRRIPQGRLYKVDDSIGFMKAAHINEAAERAEKTFASLEKLNQALKLIQDKSDNAALKA